MGARYKQVLLITDWRERNTDGGPGLSARYPVLWSHGHFDEGRNIIQSIKSLCEEKIMDLSEWIESNRLMFVELSNEVWGYAELGYKEFESSKTLEDALEETGFKLERGVAGIPTAFVASYGNADAPVIGILGEFDALPGLSQDRSEEHTSE